MAQPSPPAARRGSASSIAQEELRGISRTVAEIEWLMLALALLYLVFGGAPPDHEPAISMALFFYAAFVMSFRYTNFFRPEARWKIAIETLGMLVFITWVVWFTGKLGSPLLNAYLLPVITSALTLGKATTFAQVVLIAACYVLLGWDGSAEATFGLPAVGGLTAHLLPVLLVAYITTMFSADIHYGLNKAKLLSETDELTGLFNTRGFAIVANRIFGQATRYNRPVSVLMVDSDNLKLVNDRLGHEAGNRLLKQLAESILTELRHTDVPARYGGDEFIVLLPETPLKGAMDVAERIRSAIAAKPLLVEGERLECSVSIGVACFPEDGRGIDSVLARADRAMYQAKEQGRNRVLHFQPA